MDRPDGRQTVSSPAGPDAQHEGRRLSATRGPRSWTSWLRIMPLVRASHTLSPSSTVAGETAMLPHRLDAQLLVLGLRWRLVLGSRTWQAPVGLTHRGPSPQAPRSPGMQAG